MGDRQRWIKIVAVFLAFMMLLPVVAVLIGALGDEASIGPIVDYATAAIQL